jgi:hypothetical protein
MEVFAIILAIPVAFVPNMLYCQFLVKIVSRSERVSRWMRVASHIVLGAFAVELILLVTLGAVRSRAVIGPGFYAAHMLCFFLATPALANLLVLPSGGRSFSKWYVATVLCTALAFLLVLLQYGVSESLYGIDSEKAPYSNLHLPIALLDKFSAPGVGAVGVEEGDTHFPAI